MKKTTASFLLSCLVIIMTGCAEQNKEKELAKLKSKQAELNEKILSLEKEIAAVDTVKQEDEGISVRIEELQPAEFTRYVQLQGVVDSRQNVMLTTEVGGTVTKVLVKEGDKVSKGQLLAEMDASVLLANMAELNTRIELAKTSYERQKRLYEQEIGTEMQYLQSKNNYEALVKNKNALQNQYNKFQIRAPFSGNIDMVQTKVGEMLAPGMPALRIINLENLEIKAEVSEKYVGKFAINDNATVMLTGINDTLKAKVSSISQVINNNNRTFIMILKPLNKVSKLKPNLLAIVQIRDFNAKNAISVPAAVVQSKNNKQYLTKAIQENNVWKAKVVSVETGPVQSGRVLVQSGVDAGDHIITNGYLNVLDGDKINPIK